MVHDMIILLCSAEHGFWLMKESAELVEGPTGCGEGVRSECLFAWNFNVTKLIVLTEVERRPTPNTMLLLHY